MSASEQNNDVNESTSESASEQETVEVSAETVEPTEAPAIEDDELNLGQEQVLEFLSYVMVNLVDHPDDISVDIVRREGRDVYQVKVHEEDLGKVIGKGGQTARALRVMLSAVSARTDQRIGLEIVE